MRLFLLIALVLVVGSAALLSTQNPAIRDQITQTLSFLRVPTPVDDDEFAEWTAQFEHTAQVPFVQDEWRAMSGFPSYQELEIPLPRRVESVEGRLRLQLRSQLVPGGTGSIRISINGTRRAEFIMTPGRQNHSIRLSLSREDLAQRSLIVNLASTGQTSLGACPANPAPGAVVEILPESALDLALAAPFSSAADHWISKQWPARVALRKEHRQELVNSLMIGARLSQAGTPFQFTDSSEADLLYQEATADQDGTLFFDAAKDRMVIRDPAALAIILPELRRSQSNLQPSNVIDFEADYQARSFSRAHRWRITYDLFRQKLGYVPRKLDLHFRTSVHEGEDDWIVNVRLNSTLVDSTFLEKDATVHHLEFELPADLQLSRNEITVDLISTAKLPGACSPGIDRTAQLLDDTTLVGPSVTTPGTIAHVISRLGRRSALFVTADETLSLGQAILGAKLLGRFVPIDLPLSKEISSDSQPTIHLLNREGAEARLTELLASSGARDVYLIYADPAAEADDDGLQIQQLPAGFSDSWIRNVADASVYALVVI